MATMPTPSMSLSFGRVLRSADSHVRVTPLGSLYVFLDGCQVQFFLQGFIRAMCLYDCAYFTSFVHTASLAGYIPVKGWLSSH
jgi:hypothetical protein